MIYESIKGQEIKKAAVSALERNCDKFLHNNKLFSVDVNWRQIGHVSDVKITEKPVEVDLPAKPIAAPVAKSAPKPVTITETKLISKLETYLEANGPTSAISLMRGAEVESLGIKSVTDCLTENDRFQLDARGFWELKRVAELR